MRFFALVATVLAAVSSVQALGDTCQDCRTISAVDTPYMFNLADMAVTKSGRWENTCADVEGPSACNQSDMYSRANQASRDIWFCLEAATDGIVNIQSHWGPEESEEQCVAEFETIFEDVLGEQLDEFEEEEGFRPDLTYMFNNVDGTFHDWFIELAQASQAFEVRVWHDVGNQYGCPKPVFEMSEGNPGFDEDKYAYWNDCTCSRDSCLNFHFFDGDANDGIAVTRGDKLYIRVSAGDFFPPVEQLAELMATREAMTTEEAILFETGQLHALREELAERLIFGMGSLTVTANDDFRPAPAEHFIQSPPIDNPWEWNDPNGWYPDPDSIHGMSINSVANGISFQITAATPIVINNIWTVGLAGQADNTTIWQSTNVTITNHDTMSIGDYVDSVSWTNRGFAVVEFPMHEFVQIPIDLDVVLDAGETATFVVVRDFRYLFNTCPGSLMHFGMPPNFSIQDDCLQLDVDGFACCSCECPDIPELSGLSAAFPDCLLSETIRAFNGWVTYSKLGGGGADPHFLGYDGRMFDFHGEPDAAFAVLSTPKLQMNALMSQPQCDFKADEGRTLMSEIGLLVLGHEVTFSAEGEATFDGVEMIAGEEYPLSTNEYVVFNKAHKDSIHANTHMIVKTNEIKITLKSVWARQCSDSTYRVDFTTELLQSTLGMHGILGQTNSAERRARDLPKVLHEKNHLQGEWQDYEVNDGILGHQFAFSLYDHVEHQRNLGLETPVEHVKATKEHDQIVSSWGKIKETAFKAHNSLRQARSLEQAE